MRLFFAVLVAAAMLMWVSILNGGPIAYPDSFAYEIDGERLAHLTAPYGVRPIFYGVAIWPFVATGQFWALIYVQALIVAHLIWLVMRCVVPAARPSMLLVAAALLAILTPVAWHVSHVLPDVFVAVLVLVLFLLGCCRDLLGRGEQAWLVVLGAAATSFHLTAVPLAGALFIAAVIARVLGCRDVQPAAVALPLGLALAGSLLVNGLIWQRLTLAANSPPAPLARLLADGPARDFLRARCPTQPFELCRYLDHLPATEDGFTWGMLPSLPVADGKRIKVEAAAVVTGTVAMFPGTVLADALGSAAHQAITFGSETQLPPDQWAQLQAGGSPLALATRDTLQAAGWLDRPRLDTFNAVHAVVIGASLVAALVLLARSRRASRSSLLLGTVLLALGVNASATSPLNGVFARYEGRVIWLLPLAVLVAFLSVSRGPRSPRTGSRTGSTPR